MFKFENILIYSTLFALLGLFVFELSILFELTAVWLRNLDKVPDFKTRKNSRLTIKGTLILLFVIFMSINLHFHLFLDYLNLSIVHLFYLSVKVSFIYYLIVLGLGYKLHKNSCFKTVYKFKNKRR